MHSFSFILLVRSFGILKQSYQTCQISDRNKLSDYYFSKCVKFSNEMNLFTVTLEQKFLTCYYVSEELVYKLRKQRPLSSEKVHFANKNKTALKTQTFQDIRNHENNKSVALF